MIRIGFSVQKNEFEVTEVFFFLAEKNLVVQLSAQLNPVWKAENVWVVQVFFERITGIVRGDFSRWRT